MVVVGLLLFAWLFGVFGVRMWWWMVVKEVGRVGVMGRGDIYLSSGRGVPELVEGYISLRAERMKGGDAFGDRQGA